MLVSLVLCVGWNFANCVQGLRSFLVWRACRCKRYCRVRLSSESALKEVVVWNFVGVVGTTWGLDWSFYVHSLFYCIATSSKPIYMHAT
jgi:hypothetical protein